MNGFVDMLAMPLPEDILKRKWAGDLQGAVRAIDRRLGMELPELLRQRLVCERERIRRLPTQYPWNRAEALERLRSLVPTVTEEQFDDLEDQGRIDFIYLEGEKRYFVRFHRTLAKQPDLMRQAGIALRTHDEWLDPMIARLREAGSMACRITLESSIGVDAEAFVPGEYLVHLPFPAETAQQSDIRLLAGDPGGIAPANAPARSAHWRRRLEACDAFRMRYSYVSTIRYADPLGRPAPEEPLYPRAAPPCEADLAESGAFMRFTPYLRRLADGLTMGAKSPAEKAWRCYEFVTTRVDYAFMRDYFQIDHLNEYCAVNLKGDCGLQTLLFILLCRIAGIPARWQSGLAVSPAYTGSHDWAQFYLDGWGWLFADCSYGGSAWRNASPERHRFYFGNIDPMRMAANSAFQAALSPELHALRADPYDNQGGEIERIGAAEPFTMRQIDGTAELVDFSVL